MIRWVLSTVIVLFFMAPAAFSLTAGQMKKAKSIAREWSARQENTYPPEIRNYRQFIKANWNHLIPLYQSWVSRPSWDEMEKGGVNMGDKSWGKLKAINAFQMNSKFFVICRYENNTVLYMKNKNEYSPIKLARQGWQNDIQLIKPGEKAPVFLLTKQGSTWQNDYEIFQFQKDGAVKWVSGLTTWRGGIDFFDVSGTGWMEIVSSTELNDFPESLSKKLKHYTFTRSDIDSVGIIREMSIYRWNGKVYKQTGSYVVIDTGESRE
jgi:hypothetical protein